MSALHILADQYRAAAAELAEGEFDDATIADTLEGFAADLGLEDRAIYLVKVAQNVQAHAAAITDAIVTMDARAKAAEKRAERILDYVRDCLMRAGIKKISAPEFDIALRATPVAVHVIDAALIPITYMRHSPAPPPAPDKRAIKAAIEAGQTVAGTELRTGQRLEVK